MTTDTIPGPVRALVRCGEEFIARVVGGNVVSRRKDRPEDAHGPDVATIDGATLDVKLFSDAARLEVRTLEALADGKLTALAFIRWKRNRRAGPAGDWLGSEKEARRLFPLLLDRVWIVGQSGAATLLQYRRRFTRQYDRPFVKCWPVGLTALCPLALVHIDVDAGRSYRVEITPEIEALLFAAMRRTGGAL